MLAPIPAISTFTHNRGLFTSMHTVIKLWLKLSLVCLFSLSSSLCLAQANAGFLELLDGEASHLTFGEKTKAKLKNPTKVKPSSNSLLNTNQGMPQGLSFDDFMNNLKVNYIGTYFFAKKLSTSKQNNIYMFYQKNNNPHDIRSEIIKINKKNN